MLVPTTGPHKYKLILFFLIKLLISIIIKKQTFNQNILTNSSGTLM